MKLLLLLGLVLSSFASLAKVEMKSIYFDTIASEATGLSKGKLLEHVDLIEPSSLKITSTEKGSKPLEIPALEEIVENRPIALPILFQEGTNDVLSEDQAYLDHLYKTLKKHSTLKAEIRGHVCCENNMKASKNRAKVVYRYLVKQGIDKNRLTFKGFSNSQPISYPEKNDADRMRNRRVDIVFIK